MPVSCVAMTALQMSAAAGAGIRVASARAGGRPVHGFVAGHAGKSGHVYTGGSVQYGGASSSSSGGGVGAGGGGVRVALRCGRGAAAAQSIPPSASARSSSSPR